MQTDLALPSRRALFLGLLATASAAACGGGGNPNEPSQNATWIANVPFSTQDLQGGEGEEVINGLRISVDYFGWLYNTTTADNKGSLFDASCQTTCSPIAFTVGAGSLIRGFEQGVLGMRIGGIRRVIIPPDLAYGSTGSGTIPPNATIIFEIRVNAVVPTT